jgi:hypothetical protein
MLAGDDGRSVLLGDSSRHHVCQQRVVETLLLVKEK